MPMLKQLLWRRFILSAAVVCVLSAPVTAAQAASASYSFKGNIDGAGNQYSVSGSFDFNNETSVSGGVYNGAVKNFNFNIFHNGNLIYTPSFTAGTDIVTISNNANVGGDLRDRWALTSAVTGDPLIGLGGEPITPFSFDFRLDDRGNMADPLAADSLSSTDLQNPPSFTSLAGSPLTAARWRLFLEDADDNPAGAYVGSITSLTAVPLPAGVVLFGIGLISLVGLGAGGVRNLRGSRV